MFDLIGINGKKGSGKSEAAKTLVREGYTILKFADALKDMVCEIVGCTREELEERKEESLYIYIGYREFDIIVRHTGFYASVLGPLIRAHSFDSIRHLLQYLGTNVIRVVDENWHIKKLSEKLTHTGLYAIDDMRFSNEAEFVSRKGGATLRIIRPGVGKDAHESETALDSHLFDYVIINDGDLPALRAKVEGLVKELQTV